MTDKITDSQKLREHWKKELDAEEKAHKKFREKGKRIMERYEDDRPTQELDQSRFNILWSNVEVISAALYSRTPKPDIRRRYMDKDPVAREVSEIMERALEYTIDAYDFDSTINSAVSDYLLPGITTTRVRYQPYFEKGDAPVIPLRIQEDISINDADGLEDVKYAYFDGEDEVEEAGVLFNGDLAYMNGEPEDELVYEELTCEPVPWGQFRWQPAKRWEDVDWAAIDHFLTKEELEDQFGEEKAKQIPLSYSDEGQKLSEEKDGKVRAKVHEIFDKINRKIIVMADGYADIIEEVEDPLELENFYPFPPPLCATTTSTKLIPIADYMYYQDQAIELDVLTQRIAALTDQLRYRGIYDATFTKLADLCNAEDGQLLPVDDFAERFEGKGKLESVLFMMPLVELAATISKLRDEREGVKETIYEITGIADIMRGSSKASETLGAQQIKAQFGGMRISKRQSKVDGFIRNLFRIKAEIIAEHFDDKTLEMMTEIPVTPQMREIMDNDLLRSFRIDIETDSTVIEDKDADRQRRIEFLKVVTGFLAETTPLVQARLMTPETQKELLLFAVRAFPAGRQLEDMLESMGQQQAPGMPQQMPGGPPGAMPPGRQGAPQIAPQAIPNNVIDMVGG